MRIEMSSGPEGLRFVVEGHVVEQFDASGAWGVFSDGECMFESDHLEECFEAIRDVMEDLEG